MKLDNADQFVEYFFTPNGTFFFLKKHLLSNRKFIDFPLLQSGSLYFNVNYIPIMFNTPII